MAKENSIFMGPRLRRIRRDLGLTQASMAEDIGVSPSYIALMERNQRPMTADVLLRLAKTYRLDLASLASDRGDEFNERLAAAARDPLFSDLEVSEIEITDFSNSFPATAEAFLRLHDAYQEGQRVLADEDRGENLSSDPVAEARKFLSINKNNFPIIDDAAENLAKKIAKLGGYKDYFATRRLKVRRLPAEVMMGSVRRFDQHRNELVLDETLDSASYTFQLALQAVYLELRDAIKETLRNCEFDSENGQQLTRRALANYAAGALMMPYRSFVEAAKERHYDIEALSRLFRVSFEQVAHRLTTLQKSGEEGVPFFFIRVDAAGNVSKRLDGAGFPFARHGGSCPLWSLHHAFQSPRKILTEWVELPDGEQFFSIARTVTAGGGAYGAPRAERAIALGCAAKYAEELVYAKESQVSRQKPTMIGVGCRLCHRVNCIARAEPPLGRQILADDFRRTSAPFGLADR